MGQVLHGCATTTEAIRRAIQNSEESLRALSARYGINQKTVAKLTCHGIFPPSAIRVWPMERTDDEEGTTDGRTDHRDLAGA